MGRKLQIILGLSLVMIFTTSIVPADSNFSMFDLRQAFAQTDFGPPGVEEGDIVVISPFNGLCFPFPPCGERFGAVFEIDRSDGTVTKIFDSFLHGFIDGGITPEQEFEIDIAIDPFGNPYVLDDPGVSIPGVVYQTELPCLDPSGSCDKFSFPKSSRFQDPLPSRPVAMDTSSSGQIYVVSPKPGEISPFPPLFNSGLLVNVDITDCLDDSGFSGIPKNCLSNVVSDWFDSTQGITWPTIPLAPETFDRHRMVDVAFAEAPVGSAVFDTAYVLEFHRICDRVDPFDSDNCIRFAGIPRVWAVDVTTGNREIINTFDDSEEGPEVFNLFPQSIAVMNSGNLLVSLNTAIYEIDPVTRARTLFSDLSDSNDGVTGFMGKGLEVERTTGLIFGIGAGGLVEIDPDNGFRTLISDLVFEFAPTDIFTISAFDLAIVPAGVGPDNDGDGVIDSQDVCPGFDDNVDSDGDGIPDGCDVCPGFDDNVDLDGDGVSVGCDCDDADPFVNPGATEVCDGIDNNCDSQIDEGQVCAELDSDNDGVPDEIENLLVGNPTALETTLDGAVDAITASVDSQTGEITIEVQDTSSNLIFEIILPSGTQVDGNSITFNAIKVGNGLVVEVNGLLPPPPGKTITLLADPLATSVCIIDRSTQVILVNIPICTATDISVSQVILNCDGVTQTFTGFPESPVSRDYTCTQTVDGLFFIVEGLAFSFVSSSLPAGPPVGGTMIPIDTTALLLAGVQSISMWMIPVVASIAIGVFVIKRRK